jgi:hypothetical protein
MTDLTTRTLQAEAVLGKDAEEFLASDLGRVMLARAVEEEREALDALAVISPWRRRRITQLQAQLWRARSFKEWLTEVVITGQQALQQLEQQSEAPE